MRPLRYLYLLALVMWLGGMSIAGLVVAPATFGVLEAWNPTTGRVLAGQVFVLTVQRLLGPRPRSYGIRVGLLGLMLALTVYSGVSIAPRIDRLQAEVAGPMNTLAATDPRRVEFDHLHGLSTALVMATLVGGLVLMAWETRE
jgi:hypothetical protein